MEKARSQNEINYINQLETICMTGVAKRFKKDIKMPGHFRESVEILNKSDRILLVTGFCIKAVMTGETDGPIGTVVLARALEQLGKKVVIVTDDYSKEYVEAGLNYYQSKVETVSVALDFDRRQSRDLMDRLNPDLLYFIERPSKSVSGEFHSMNGEGLVGFIPDTDILFQESRKRNIPIGALGDGGNETGMALLREHIVDHVHLGDQICAATASDWLLVSGVSNWGCYTLVGGLSILNALALLPRECDEVKHLETIVSLGAVDGVSKKAEVSVDGYTLEENMAVLRQTHQVIDQFLTK